MGERKAFVRSVRYDDGGSNDLRVEKTIEV